MSILENGIKLTNEGPQGIRASLLRSYSNDLLKDPEFFENSKKPV